MPKTTIAFQGGAYGNYVLWILYSLLTDGPLVSPFKGSTSHNRDYIDKSHKDNNEIRSTRFTLERLATENVKLTTIHPVTDFDQDFCNELDKISNCVEKVLVPYIDHSTYLLGLHNYLFKSRLALNEALAYIDREDLHKGWGIAPAVDLESVPRWILREHHSFNVFNSWESQCGWFAPNNFVKGNCKFIFISDLFFNFLHVIEQIRSFLDVQWKKDPKTLLAYHKQNISAQQYMNQDILVKQILNSIFNDQNFQWKSTDLTLYSESYIQKTLREQNIMLNCTDLNQFPTSTSQLIKEFA
jgi:hypothetical protein